MEYHSYGKGHLQIFNCSVAAGQRRGWDLNSDYIYVFLNYKQLGKFKDKASAKKMIENLIKECPDECKQDFHFYGNELLQTIS